MIGDAAHRPGIDSFEVSADRLLLPNDLAKQR
jgi:hypothetical protein